MKQLNIGPGLCFFHEETAWPGVRRVAGMVQEDIRLVTGTRPADATPGDAAGTAVLYGTVGRSAMLDALEQSGKIALDGVRGKWEVYLFALVEDPLPGIRRALVIAGSDKRGTIYGLFHLSERIGVSPLVHWNHVWPRRRAAVTLTAADEMLSKEPSVRYRGFFINDEWPAFGTWARTHFGGVNAACYAQVFELLLRLKGNYFWPAMWSTNFSLDGPGLQSAELADELGVVMSTSHHEPCMRSGEEYTGVRGPGSPYGDAWDFAANPEGITRFWRDGLRRNSRFENVITLGMRGERDTPLLGRDSDLRENIELLRRILKTQNRLIREEVNPDLARVPRQLVLFTEVEGFLYGTDEVPGLLGDPELDGVTLMLSDNNRGYTRTLPTAAMRAHNGGFGMYYHQDMHGGAQSFEWIGSTYLPRLWEQMTMAYDYGVREIWITNIGDIGTQELGLSYFLDLAYDVDRWGGRDAAVTQTYLRQWLETQFAPVFAPQDLDRLARVEWDYTLLLERCKHESMHADTYDPVHFGEAEDALALCERIENDCDALRARCPDTALGAFVGLVGYPACATANLAKMWLLAGRNELYARQNRVEANRLADAIGVCLDRDALLTEEYHTVDKGMYYGFGLSEHIGFTRWNEDDNEYPVRRYIHPAAKPRMILARTGETGYLTGSHWRDPVPLWEDALRPDVDTIDFDIACGSARPLTWRIETDCPWLRFSARGGVTGGTARVTLTVDKTQLTARSEGRFRVYNVGYGDAEVRVAAEPPAAAPAGVFLERDGYIAMEADHYAAAHAVDAGAFAVLAPYGKTGAAVKVYPTTADFLHESMRPWVEYRFIAAQAGAYRLRFYLAPSTPVTYEPHQYIGFSLNGGETVVQDTVLEDRPFFGSDQWRRESIDSIKLAEADVVCRAGENRLRFYGMSPAIVLERVVLWPADRALPGSYLGPRESWRGPAV